MRLHAFGWIEIYFLTQEHLLIYKIYQALIQIYFLRKISGTRLVNLIDFTFLLSQYYFEFK